MSDTGDTYIDQEAEEDNINADEDLFNEDEENEDEDYADSPAKKKRKTTQKKIRTAVDFIESEAQVDDDNEEEEEDAEMETDFIHPRDENVEVPSVAAQMANRDRFKERGNNKLLERLEERYVHDNPQIEDDEEEGSSEDKGRRRNKADVAYRDPRREDPKLFRVKCIPGKEKDIVFVLLQKFYNLLKLRPEDQMQMTSALCVPGVKGFIYVEAYLERNAKHAIHGVPQIQESSLKLVPMKEMDQVLNVERTKEVLKKDQWVRINKGLYKGDLGQIVGVDESRGFALVRLIPRLEKPKTGADEVTIEDPSKDDENADDSKKDKAKPKRKTERPQQMLLQEFRDRYLLGSTEGEEENSNSTISRQRDTRTGYVFDIFGGQRFKDGLLYKDISLKTLQTKEINPKYEEVELFRKALESSQETGKLFNSLSQHIRSEFKKGDLVRVIAGDLKNLIGKVADVDAQREMVSIIPDSAHNVTQNQLIQQEPKLLQKYFPPGAYCRVVSGRHVGKFGYIVSTNDEEGEAILYVKTNSDETSTDPSSDPDADAKAVEIRLFISELEMTSSASTANTTTYLPNQKLPPHMVGKQHNANNARTFSNRQGFNSPRGRGRGGRGGFAGGRNGPVGKSVRVLKGSFKGRIGICKYLGKNSVRIELHTMYKTIDIKFDETDADGFKTVCRVIEDQNSGSDNLQASSDQKVNSATPMTGGETPALFSSQTPQRGVGGWGDAGSVDDDYHSSYDPQSVTSSHLSPLDSATPYSTLSSGPHSATTYGSGIGSSSIMTPGVGMNVPNTPGMIPLTPGLPMNHPVTPGLGMNLPTTPGLPPTTPGVGLGAPMTPGIVPMTPGIHAPVTPGMGPLTPYAMAASPGSAMTPGFSQPTGATPYQPATPSMTPFYSDSESMGRDNSFWMERKVLVSIISGNFQGASAIIQSVSEYDVEVLLPNAKVVRLNKSQIQRAIPAKGDTVKILPQGVEGYVKQELENREFVVNVGNNVNDIQFIDVSDMVVLRDRW